MKYLISSKHYVVLISTWILDISYLISSFSTQFKESLLTSTHQYKFLIPMSETICVMINGAGHFKSYIIIESYVLLEGESIEMFSAT